MVQPQPWKRGENHVDLRGSLADQSSQNSHSKSNERPGPPKQGGPYLVSIHIIIWKKARPASFVMIWSLNFVFIVSDKIDSYLIVLQLCYLNKIN